MTERGRAVGGGSLGWALLLAAASGGLYFAAFPPFDLGALAFVSLAPLFLALRGRSARQAFLLGWLSGTIGICALVSGSIYGAAARYFGDGGVVLVLFALIVPQLHGALYFGLFALLARGWERRPALASVMLLPAAWAACELARASIGYGAPWILLGHSQHARLWLAQIADLGGVFAVSFAVAMANAALAIGVERGVVPPGRRATIAAVAATVVVLVAVRLYGERQLRRWAPSAIAGEEIEVALVQPNLSLHGRASLAAAAGNLARLVALTRGLDGTPDLVVWPENAVGFSLAANPELLAGATRALPESGRLLLGAPREIATAGGVLFRNSAFLLDRGGHIVGTYDKLRLTPFAESSPWTHVPLLRRRFAASDIYTPGERLELFEVKGAPVATLICYEAIYPDLAREAVRAGAQLLVNISNDDWFGQRPALAQHFDATLFRAIESRRFLVRATNSGLTAVIDPRGAIVAAAPPAEEATLTATVKAVRDTSVYSLLGDLFAWACVALTMVSLIRRA